MFVGSDALALAPFTDEVCYLEDGDWAVLTREASPSATRRQAGRSGQSPARSHRAPGRQGQPPPLHGEGDPRAARSGRPYARRARRSLPGPRRAPELPFDFAKLTGSRSRPAARPSMPVSSPNIGSSAGRTSRRRRYRLGDALPAGWAGAGRRSRSSSRSLARPPTRLRHCATAASTARAWSPSSTCGNSSIAREVGRHDADARRS